MIRTSFINVDLELYSKEDLSSIASELKGRIYPLTNEYVDDVYNLAFECSMNDQEPSVVLEKFLALLDQLSDESALLLASCDKKMFDIGYDSGDDGFVSNNISNELLRKVTALGFDIKVTVYPISESDEQ
ncbi:hypothetical protein [Ketobacter alkanivorans]|uniref:DUF4279 domain-containing protein n=1 Tax=Ketobacter alkanivorans TaxID=1917421 RepID=A0A2K9LRG2_9GAMM|nr:hypothetical protein [Ketobacter alkanivorans]AUM14731.1 hypothetical protein Kalk_20875 [Ketobacter alkanivorans]